MYGRHTKYKSYLVSYCGQLNKRERKFKIKIILGCAILLFGE